MTCGDEINDDSVTLDKFMAVVYADETDEYPMDNACLVLEREIGGDKIDFDSFVGSFSASPWQDVGEN